ncbi:MAG: apolipoprotein N-acyltransferase [Deltaproteobacteria bacterium]|nr:apolipoprotein N-acyltransferase [Deltaproteobacteria bacterium]
MDRKAFILSAASGVLLFISFPAYEFHYVIWVAIVPLLYALKGRSLSQSFFIGLISGLVYNVGIIYWVSFVVVHYGYLPLYLGISVMLLLALYLSLYVSLFSVALVYLRRKGIRDIYSAPLLWTVFEFAKAHFLTGFPWENLAHSQYDFTLLIQIADVTGIFGITFLIVLINCAFYDLLTMQLRKTFFKEVISVTIVFGLIIFYGFYRIENVQNSLKDTDHMNVSLIQGNIDQSVKWDPKFQMDTLRIYRELSFMASASEPSLIVWPETAAPFYFQNIDEMHENILDIARRTGAYLLLGSPSYVNDKDRYLFKNSVYMVSPEGKIVGRYDKTHLVPFGEYVPFKKFLFFVQKLVVGAGDFIPGDGITTLTMDGKGLGVLICYEGIFPEISSEYGAKGSTLLVNVTNDAWYGWTSAPYQHLTMAVFRAVENRTHFVRAANTGISAIIDPTGKIISRTGLFERAVLNGRVQLSSQITFYELYGDLFVYVCGVLILVVFLFSLTRRRVRDDRNYL